MTDEVVPEKSINSMNFQELRAYARSLEKQAKAEPSSTPDNEALLAELAELRSLQASHAGWLITTKNILYDGTTHGVKFAAGMAFIPVNAKFPKYHVEPPKEGLKEMARMSDADWKKTLERSKRTDAEVVVELITRDMRGYKAEFFDVAHQRELQNVTEARRKEYQEALEKVQGGQNTALTAPGYVGA